MAESNQASADTKGEGNTKESSAQSGQHVIDYDDTNVKGCFFDFRIRTHSFDLHLLGQRKKNSRLAQILRSKSDSSVKPSSQESPAVSPAISPHGSPQTARRRRFVRVVRDNDAPGEEFDNPNVVRKYTTGYWENCQKLAKKTAEENERAGLPYTVSGHTILKKQQSRDDSSGDHLSSLSSTPHRHAAFCDEVRVIEFDRKNKVEECTIGVHSAQLLNEELCTGEPDFTVPENCASRDLNDPEGAISSQPFSGEVVVTITDRASDKVEDATNCTDVDDDEVVSNRFSRLTATSVDGLIIKSLKKLREELETESPSVDKHKSKSKKGDKHIRFSVIESESSPDTSPTAS